MSTPLYITAGERSAEEILEAVNEGRRVVITVTMVGEEYDVTLRYDGSMYYCDTPTRLHRHEQESEMRQCIRRMGYGTESVDAAVEPTNSAMADDEHGE